MVECRRKGIPQAKYWKNGFIDTSMRLLGKIQRSSLTRQSVLSKERDKWRSVCVRTFQQSLEEASQILWRSRHTWKNGTSVVLWFNSFLSILNCFQVMRSLDLPKHRSPIFQLKSRSGSEPVEWEHWKTLAYQRKSPTEYQILSTHTKETTWIQDPASFNLQ